MATFEPARLVSDMMKQSERPVIGPSPAGTIGLGAGDPDFRTPTHIRQAMIDAVNEGYSNYPPMTGDPDLLQALADYLERRYEVDWNTSDITITNGGSGALYASLAGYLNPGDAVLLPEPTYSQYADITRLVGAEVIWVKQTADWHLDPDAIRAAAVANPRAKILVINNPNNPTGVVYGRAELEATAAVAEECNLLVLADEGYDHLILDDIEFTSTMDIEGFQGRLIYCNSFSKTFAMTGWRLGWVAASPGLTPPIARVSRTSGGWVNWALQRAGIAAMNGPMEETEAMRVEYAARRDLIEELLDGAEGVSWTRPQGAFYAFFKYDAPVTSRRMSALLRERGVALRSGSEYGPSGEGYIRLAFAADRAAITEGMLRMRSTMAEAREGKIS